MSRCCDMPKCPSSKKGGDKSYCDAVPFGLCCPDYSDSFCETYNNNPNGPKPDSWADSIRKSCCSSVNHGGPTCNPNSCCCGSSNNSGNSANSNGNRSSCAGSAGSVLNYREVYVGFNENMYGKTEDPCCKKPSENKNSQNNGKYCCGNNFNKV